MRGTSPAILLAAAFACGCGELGKVNQGRAIAFDAGQGLVTLISDSNYADPKHPRYDVLPPEVVRVPQDPKEMGPAPDAGALIHCDLEKLRLTVFDTRSGSFRDIAFRLVSRRDRAGESPSRYPLVDRGQKSVAIYLPDSDSVVTLSVDTHELSLPDNTWRFGDEVRYYYKQPGQALRMMNVTKTDIMTSPR